MSQMNEKIKSFTASTTLAPYLRVKESTADQSVAVAGPYDDEVGITERNALAINDLVAVRLANVGGSRKVTCASVCSIGDRLFPTTAGLVDTKGANNLGTAGAAIGPGGFIALEACATALGIVEALPISGALRSGILFVGTGDSTAITGTAEQAFDKNTFTIPANKLLKGDILKIKARAVVTGQNGTDTDQIQIYLSTVKILDCSARDLDVNEEVLIDATLVVTDIGATGHVKGFGSFTAGDLITSVAASNFTLASTAIDTTAAALVKATSIWSGANAANLVVLRDLIVELVRQ